jgi:hypothetical protein
LRIATDILEESAASIVYFYIEDGATASPKISATIHNTAWYHNPEDYHLNYHHYKKASNIV